jgi:hypothetical protein
MDDLFPSGFDRTYFSTAQWSDRVETWVTEHADVGFTAGNEQVIRSLLEDDETGLRMVVNITAHALLSMLKEKRYRNLYESPVVGGGPKTASAVLQNRIDLALAWLDHEQPRPVVPAVVDVLLNNFAAARLNEPPDGTEPPEPTPTPSGSSGPDSGAAPDRDLTDETVGWRHSPSLGLMQ